MQKEKKIHHRSAASLPPYSSSAALRISCLYVDEDQSLTSLSEDIIVGEILPRLPVKTVFKFKCISKRYESIISDPKFAQYYMQQAYTSYKSWSSSGLFSSMLFPFTGGLSLFNKFMDLNDTLKLPNDGRSINVCLVSLPHDNQAHTILGSSNGLILSVFHPDRLKLFKYGLCVSNPLTKQCVQIPDSTLTRYSELEFIISARHDKAESAFLTYKIVIIRAVPGAVLPNNHTNTAVSIFSSDTGSWVSRELCCPRKILDHTTCRAVVSYKGILHWLDQKTDTIITYNPFDSPDQFGHIQLPIINCSDSYLLFSGDHEMLKYCGIGSFVLSVWSLVDHDKEKWCLNRWTRVSWSSNPSMPLMVAPHHWNPELICRPFLGDGFFIVINLQGGLKIHEPVWLETEHESDFRVSGHRYPLVPIELCPWSSPLYAPNLV